MHPQTLVAYGMDGHLLAPAHGAPARVHSPVKLGYKNTKYLTQIVFMPTQNGGYWSDQGYEWYGGHLMSDVPEVTNNPAAGRFEILTDQGTAHPHLQASRRRPRSRSHRGTPGARGTRLRRGPRDRRALRSRGAKG